MALSLVFSPLLAWLLALVALLPVFVAARLLGPVLSWLLAFHGPFLSVAARLPRPCCFAYGILGRLPMPVPPSLAVLDSAA